MGRGVFHLYTRRPKDFTTPYIYTGAQFAKDPRFVDCADKADTLSKFCKDLRVCVLEGTTTAAVNNDHFDGSGIHVQESADLLEELTKGTCDVIAGDALFLSKEFARESGYTGEYGKGSIIICMEPIALLLREGDKEWTLFVNSILEALFTAELEGITIENATFSPETSVFGEGHKDIFQQAIAAVGIGAMCLLAILAIAMA